MNALVAAVKILQDARAGKYHPAFSLEKSLEGSLDYAFGISFENSIVVYSWCESTTEYETLYHCYVATFSKFAEFLLKNGIPDSFAQSFDGPVSLTSKMTEEDAKYIADNIEKV